MKKYHPGKRKKNSLKRRNPRNTQWKAKAMTDWKSTKQEMFRMRPPQVTKEKGRSAPRNPTTRNTTKKPLSPALPAIQLNTRTQTREKS